MSYDDDGAPAHDRAHVVLNDPFALIVERRGRLVQNENAGICDERPRNRDTLALAARKIDPTFFDHRVVALRQLSDEFVCTSESSRLHHHYTRHSGVAKRYVLVDGTVEKKVLLQHDPDLSSQPARIGRGKFYPIEHHPPHLR